MSRLQAIRRLASTVVLCALAVASFGCGNTSESCCTGGSSAQISGRSLVEDVALTVYGPNSSGHLPSAYSPDEITRRSMIRPSPPVAYRLQTQAAVVNPSPRPSPYAYILGDYGAGQIFVDDVMRVYHNDEEIFYGPGPGYNSGYFAPVRIDNVFQKDKIRIVVTDLYPGCKAMSPLILFREDGGNDIVVNATGIPYTCGEEQGQGIIFDKTVVIPSASPEVLIEDLKANPESIEPQASPGSGANTTTNITAEVITTNFEAPVGNYTLTIRPKSSPSPVASPPDEPPPAGKIQVQGSSNIDPPPFPSPPGGPPIRVIPGNLTFANGGNTASVNNVWDGKSDSGSIFPDGEYEVELSVTVTEAGGGEPRFAQKTAPVTVGGGPILEVLQGNLLIATSNPNGDRGKTQKDLLQRVCLRGHGNLTVQLRNVSDQAPTHRVDAGPTHAPIVLRRIGQTTTYGANVSVADVVLVPQLNSFTITDGHRGLANGAPGVNPAPAAEAALTGRSFQLRGRMILGADPTTFNTDINFNKDDPDVNANNFAAGGFSRVALITSDLEQNLEARFRADTQASIMVNSSHGSSSGALAESTSISGLHGNELLLTPADVAGKLGGLGYRNGLKCLTFLSCDVMRVHGYRGDYGNKPLRLQPAPGMPDPDSPGIKWRDAAGRAVTLLGYNHNSWLPFDEKVAAQTFLAQFSPTAPPEKLARDWVENSNLQASDSACAIDANGTYWFVKHQALQKHVEGPTKSHIQLWHVRREVYVVPESHWRGSAPLPPAQWFESLPPKQILIPPAAP